MIIQSERNKSCFIGEMAADWLMDRVGGALPVTHLVHLEYLLVFCESVDAACIQTESFLCCLLPAEISFFFLKQHKL